MVKYAIKKLLIYKYRAFDEISGNSPVVHNFRFIAVFRVLGVLSGSKKGSEGQVNDVKN